MSLWHDKRGTPARGLHNPGVLIARHIKWAPRLADPNVTPAQGPCPDEINVALACTRPVMFDNNYHTIWMLSTTGSWHKAPDRPVWISCQTVPDLAAWAKLTENLPWVARWMNPKARLPREYIHPTVGQLMPTLGKNISNRWQGIDIDE